MRITRREFVGSAIAAGVSAVAADAPSPSDDADFSFVHLTDMHVTPKRRGDQGYAACIADVRTLSPQPSFALMGGDLAFDGLYTARERFEEQIRLYKRISAGLGMPQYPCMGNHDVLGWSARRKVSPSDPDLGKKLIMDRLEWEKSYYSFDYGGWHFAVLDSIYPKMFDHGPGYEPRIGDEQLHWLAYDLGSAGERPKVVLTHIAAFCNQGQIAGNTDRKSMDGSMVLWDTKPLREVLERHHVKALLQGHSHDIESYRYNGVWYLTSAAVSGAWWAGDWVGSAPGYTIFRCSGENLSWTRRIFAWEAQLDPQDELERHKVSEWNALRKRQHDLALLERHGR